MRASAFRIGSPLTPFRRRSITSRLTARVIGPRKDFSSTLIIAFWSSSVLAANSTRNSRELDGRPDVARRFIGHASRLRALWISFSFRPLRHQVQPPITLGQLLQRLAVGRVADEQPQLLHARQPLRDALQP